MSGANLFAVILAAGYARRFGGAKQLAAFDGEPLVRGAVRAAENVCAENTLLVLGHEWRNVYAACAPQRGFFVHNDAFETGMGSSIAVGVRAVADIADAVMLTLCDQPLIGPAQLKQLIETWAQSDNAIVCSAHESVLGPPAIFPALYFAELMALEGDRGARELLTRHAHKVREVPSEESSHDVDTPDDLAQLSTNE